MKTYLDKIFEEVKNKHSIDLSAYQPNLLERRLDIRVKNLNLKNLSDYLSVLINNPHEYENLINTITINVSTFFRNPIVFEIIAQSVLSNIIENRRNARTQEIRVWSAGCCYGEEAYSIAILINEYLKNEPGKWIINIFATDIDSKAIEKGKAGIYEKEKFETTKLGILEKYFEPIDNSSYKIRPFLASMVKFSCHDLISTKTMAPPESIFGTFDIVLCRNVLIYFSNEIQIRVLKQISNAITKGGYLILGEVESLFNETKSDYKIIDKKNKIFQKI